MKKCSECGDEKDENDFPWRFKKRGMRASACKQCKKNRYQKNKATIIPDIAERNADRRRQLTRMVYEYKLTHPCVDCGEKDPVVLDPDHRGGKEFNVSKAVKNGYSWERVEAELAKCEMRCANCHRRRTAKEQGWRKVLNP